MERSLLKAGRHQRIVEKVDASSSRAILYRLIRRLAGYLSLGWAADLVELEYETTLEIKDPCGKDAIFSKHQRVRFLQNNVIAFQDYAWGDGEIFADYNCKPGVVVDRYREDDRWNILISLRASKQRGDVEDFYIERSVKNGFIREAEWCQVEIRNPTRRLRIAVILPSTRHSRRALVTQRSRHRSTSLGPDNVQELPDGRQMLWWEASNVRPLEIFTLKWWW